MLNCNILPPLLMYASPLLRAVSEQQQEPTLRLLSLLRLLTKSTRLTMTRNAVWALSNLCRGKNPPPAFEKVAPETPSCVLGVC